MRLHTAKNNLSEERTNPPMKKRYRQRLATLAHSLLEHYHDGKIELDDGRLIDFDMQSYAENADGGGLKPAKVNECGSSCCLLGYAPFVFDQAKKDISWLEVSNYVVGFNSFNENSEGSDLRWDFLFSEKWSNNPKLAACRVLWFLEFGETMEASDYPDDDEDPWLKRMMPLTHERIKELLWAWMRGLKPTSR